MKQRLPACVVSICSLLCLSLSVSGAEIAEGHPNIILFLVDDMGLMNTSVPFVVGANGKPVKYPLNEFYRTPNMEKLAEAGTRFTSFYAHSVCSPTRSSIMTGQNSARHRTTTWIKPQANNRGEFGPADWCWTGLDKTNTTLPRLLKTAGYRTIHVGKAHFGPNGHEGADPLNLGFDVNVGGFSAGQPGSYYGEKNYAWKGVSGQGQVPHLEKYHGTDVFLTEALTLEANRHIENAVKEKKPFFLYMSHYAVHAPFESDPRFAKNYAQSGKSEAAQAFGTLIEGMDKSLGDLLKKVRSLNVADNTLIIFLGDNGSAAPLGHTDYTSSVPFRGKKAWRYEGGMRVPFIAAWVKTDSKNQWQSQLPIPAGAIQTQTGTIMDVLPTICNLAGVQLPKAMPLDGYDLKQQLAGNRNETRKEDFLNHFPHNHRNSYFTSYVDGDWKVIYHYPVPAKGGSSEPSQKSRYELYNLKDDPFENTDLANSHTERLQTMMGALIKDLEAKNALYPEVGNNQLRPETPDELRKSVEIRMPKENPDRQDAASRVKTHPYIKTVKASSFQSGNPPVHAVDADKSSRWAARDGSFPQFLEIELKAPQQVQGVTFTFRNKTVIQYTIDVLGVDGKWKTVVDQSENGKEVQTVTHSFDADISKLKVSVLNARQGWATLSDLQMTYTNGNEHSEQSHLIAYAGKPLHSTMPCFWQASWIGVLAPEAAHDIVIQKALYGVSGDPAKQVDVAEKIREIVRSGKLTVQASNALAGRDPAYGKVKTLELEYTVNGTAQKKSILEPKSIHLVLGREEAFRDTAPPAGSNQWISFRKVVQLDKDSTQAVVRISADSKYWLWVNGERVVFDGQLKRGPTPEDTYFDRVDLTKYLKKGDNTIAVLLWYFGKTGFSHNSSGKAGLLFDAVVDGKPVLSDGSWKAIPHPAYEHTSAPYPNFRLPESHIRFDARNDMLGWQNPGFDDSAWPSALNYGVAPCAPWNQLVERPIPQWKDFGLKEYVNAAQLPKVSDGRTIKAKLPYNAQITPYLHVEGPAGAKIDIRMDNGTSGRAEYVTKAGDQSYEVLGWLSGHEVHYTIPAGYKILALKYRETGYDTEFAGSFVCDDEFFNRHHKKAMRTLYINMRDTYMDCPDRERAQWWGDVVNQLGEAFYALDTRSYDLARKGMLELTNWQREDHTIFAPIPGNWTGELKLQMLNSIGYYGFWTYYLYSGDLETLRTVYPGVRRYLSIWKVGDDGLVVSRGGSWTDWGDNKDFAVLNNGWYYLALKGQLNMAQVLGETSDVEEVQAKMSEMEQGFNKAFWTGSEYRSAEYKDLTDDRAQALAVLCGFAKPEQYDAIRKVLKEQEHCSPYMEKYVGEALYQMRLPKDALSRAKKRFKVMTDHPYTTLWENFPKSGTINHAWSGGALTLLSQYGAGVAPVTPGYGTYHVLPQMGHLKHIKATVPSVKGAIDLELWNEADAFTLQLNSPADTTAIVGIPRRPSSSVVSITANGKTVWENGKPKNLRGLKFLEETEHYIKFSAKPGSWVFVATY